jgi:hypothetical protein
MHFHQTHDGMLAKVLICEMLVAARVSRRIIGDRPSGVSAARDDCGQKTSILILANDFELLLVPRDVTNGT